MLERLDLERIFHVVKTRGYDFCEVYNERSYRTSITAENRVLSTNLSLSDGIALSCHRGPITDYFFTRLIDTQAILSLISDLSESSNASQAWNWTVSKHQPERDKPGDRVAACEKSKELENLIRITWPENESIGLCNFDYQDEQRFFEVADSNGSYSQGHEQAAGLTASWEQETPSRTVHRNADLWSTNIKDFFCSLKEENPFRKKVLQIKNMGTPWPVPAGDIPMYWSSHAFSKLLLLFLRGFEADLVLENLSFLNETHLPIPLNFSVLEMPDIEANSVDHEGSPRRAVTLFHQGRPKALACDNRVARQLSVNSTGHCRRQDPKSPPTIGLWSPVIQTPIATDSLLQKMPQGIYTDDVQVKEFHPSTAEITLCFDHASLIHGGELGEGLAPFELKTNLLNLLSAFDRFSCETKKNTLPIHKLNHRFLIKISNPSASSIPLPIPGDVPASQYW